MEVILGAGETREEGRGERGPGRGIGGGGEGGTTTASELSE